LTTPWFAEELETAALNDQRLNDRFAEILEAFGDSPNASIPAALGGRAELKAAYRFFDNEKVTPEKLLAPHFHATAKRCQAQQVVLFPQDTSELEFTRPEQQVIGAGPLTDSSRLGAFLHLDEAFTEDGTPLGAIGAKLWARDMPDPDAPKLSTAEKEKIRRSLPIEEKESIRWLEGFRTVQKFAKTSPDTTCVSLCDSEGDIYDLIAKPRITDNFHWIIRGCHDRIAVDEQNETRKTLLRDLMLELPVLFTKDITARARKQKISIETNSRSQSRKARQATVSVRAGTVVIHAPRYHKHAVRSVKVNVVFVREEHPPQGEEPIEWMLLTTLSIATLDFVRRVIQYYTVRWMIEVFFRTLKSGCRIEERRFETLPRMLACLSVYLIVAWRTLYVCRLGRCCPDLDCDLIFDPAEWQSVWSVTHRGEPLPSKPPPLSVMVRLIARLGGYVDRPNRSDPPGVETVWKGIQRMRDLAWGWQTFGPGADSS
jgi:hypothetical protein